ncbi:mucin TcMUCII, putative [Trypanosoma cruzi marinkellei]|uniref:Mucin TcMUCII, putative n=1 Tax=Trypanosoma cruzi marinkellei TaxID=85056 RepID=K2N3Q4_TRYCR|nr:mucin TcMUCII, putative [Trypanosoma cruzi marinkellei]
MMTTCRLLCALLVLALCCCSSVCVTASNDVDQTKHGSGSSHERTQEADGSSGSALLSQSSTGQASSGNPASELSVPAITAGPGTVGMVDTPQSLRNNVEQPNGTSDLQLVADPLKTVQQEAEITGTGVPGSRSASSKEYKENEGRKSEASGPVHVPSEGQDKASTESVTKEERSKSVLSNSGAGTIQKPSEKDTEETEKNDSEEPTSAMTSDNGNGTSTAPALPEGTDTTLRPTSTEQGPSGSANPMAQIGTNSTVTVQSQEETVPNTTTTTITAPEAPSTTTTEAPTTTTTGAPSRLPEIDGSLSSPAWVCAPLLLAASALAYTTLG